MNSLKTNDGITVVGPEIELVNRRGGESRQHQRPLPSKGFFHVWLPAEDRCLDRHLLLVSRRSRLLIRCREAPALDVMSRRVVGAMNS
jgi:hypothetical protein